MDPYHFDFKLLQLLTAFTVDFLFFFILEASVKISLISIVFLCKLVIYQPNLLNAASNNAMFPPSTFDLFVKLPLPSQYNGLLT